MSHIYAASALLLLSLPHGLASPVAQEVPVFRSLSSGRPARAAPTGNVVAMVGAPHRPRPAVVSSLENKLASYLAKPTRNSVEDPSTLVGDPFAFALPEAANVSVELSSGVSSITSTTTSTTTSTLTPSSPAEASIAAIQYKSIGSIATEVAPLAVSTPLIFVDPLLPTLPTPIEASGAILAAGVVADSPTPFANASVVASIVPLSSLNASVVAIPPVVESAIDLSSTVPSATALPLAAQPAVVESATPISSVVENVTTITESVIAVPSAPETVVSLLSVVASDIPVASVIESAVLFASVVESAVPLSSVVESVAPLFIATPLPSSVESAFPEVPVEEVLGPKAGALELTDFVSLVQKIADVISAFFHVLPPTADTPANILAPPASELEAPTDDLLLDDDEDVASKAKRDQQYLPMPPVTMALLLDILRNLTESAADTVRKTNTALSELSLDTGSDTLQGLGKRDTLTAEQQSLVAIAAAKVAELQLATDALKALAKSQLTKREELAIDAADLYPTIQSLINTILTAFGIPTGTMSTNLAVDPVVALTSALGSIKGNLSARSEKRQVDPNASKDLLSKFVAILEHLIQITKNVSGASPVTPTTPVAGGPFSSLSGLNGKLPTSVPAFVGTGGPFAGTGGPFAGTGGPFAGTGGPFAGTGGPLNGINPIGPPFLTGGPLAAIAALADKTPVDIASILAAPLSAASSAINVASVLSAPLASVSSVVVTLPDLPISSGSIGARGGSLRARQALGLLSSLQNLPNSAAPAAGAPGAVLLNGVQNLANPAPGVAGASPLNALQNVASPAQGVAGASPLNGVQNLVDTAQSVVGALPSVNILPLNLPSQSGSPVIGLVAGLAPKTNPVTGVLNVAPVGLVNSPTNPLASTLSPLTSALNPITSALSPLTSALSPLTSALNPFNTGFNPFPGLSSTLAGPGNVFGALNPFAGLKAGLLGGYSNPFAAYLGNFPTANLNPATGVVNALPVANVLPVTGVNPVAHVQARDNSVEGPADILPPLPQLPDGLNSVLPPLPQLPDSLNPVLTPVLSVASPVLNAVASIITPVLNAAAPIATPVLNAAQSLVDSTVPNLGGLDLLPALPQLPDSLNSVLTPALSAVSPILNAVPPIVTPVLNAAQSLVDSTVPSLGALNLPVLPQLPDSLNPVLTPALSAVSPILNAVPPIVTPVLNAVPPIVTPVLNAVPPIVTPVLDAIPPIVTPVLNAIPPIVTPVLNAIPPIVTPVLNAVAPIVTPILNAAQSLVDSTVPNLNALNLLPALAIGQGLSPLAPISPLSLPPADSLPLLGLLPPVPLGSAPPPFNPVVSPIAPGIGSLTPAPLAGTPAIPSLPNVAASPATAAPVLSATAPAKSIIVPVVNPVQNLLNTLRNFFGIHTAQVKRDTSVSAFPALNQDENHASLEQGDIQSIPNNAAHVIKAPAQRVSTLRHQELTRSSQAPFERREIVQETARDSLAGDVDQAASSTEDASESEPASGEYADDVLTEEADASSV